MDLASVFDCKMCGICCVGRGGIIVSPKDLENLALELKLAPCDVRTKFTVTIGQKLKLRTTKNGVCVFYDDQTGCTVHQNKPAVCKAWPFFRGNLLDPTSLELAKDYCPGLNPKVSHKDFACIGRKYLQDEHLLATNAATEANALIL